MPKVSVDLGLTMKVPGKDFEMLKPSVSFTDIDTDGDVEAQIQACIEATPKVLDGAEGVLAQAVADLSGMAFDGGGWTKAFTTFKESLAKWQTNIVGELTRQGDEVAKITGGEAPKRKKTNAEEKP